MNPAQLSPDERKEALTRFLARYKKRGFEIVLRTPTSAELYKPSHFPAWLFHEQTLYIDIEPSGRIFVRER